ncbi:MAG: hypothetical protein JXR97_07445 [Planctomycetes bacterium]|nr:hypothetical protein [Planctomycetota bacterium]
MKLTANIIKTPELWTLHSYYTMNPWAPDGSGRLLLSGGDLESKTGQIMIVDADGKVTDRIAQGTPLTESYWHTGFWQGWGPNVENVYYQAGTLKQPQMVRHNLATGKEERLEGGMQGNPPHGEPIISGLLGMLYGAGYGTGVYNKDLFPVPIEQREKHGLFSYDFNRRSRELTLSVQQILEAHPDYERLCEEDVNMRKRLGDGEGLTLMLYCLRWNRQGTRCLFFFGNHCVVKERGEPKITYVMTADRELNNTQVAVDISFDKRGVHWGWHADGEHLVGYGPKPDETGKTCLAQVKYDGTGYREISSHASGGHPSICPADHNLIVTDEGGIPGRVVFIDARDDTVVAETSPGRVYGDKEPGGRNPYRVCHHPVFSDDGRTVLVNTINGPLAQVALINVEPVLEEMANRSKA